MEWLRTIAISTGVVAIMSLSTLPAVFGSKLVSGITMATNLLSSSQASTAATTASPDFRYDAWVYPNAPGTLDKIRQIGYIHAIKAEFMHVNDDGTLTQINQDAAHPNGYSPDVVALMNAHSEQQYITVSGTMAGTALAMQNPDTIPAMVNFANKIGFGIELDWEEFGQWTPQYYQQYKSFVQKLSDTLHDNGHYMLLDGPPICDATSQSWYQWKYEELAPLVYSVVMMVYDNQYDTGVGGSIAPRAWTASCLQWLKNKAGPDATAGLAAYGYSGNRNTGQLSVNTSDAISRLLGGVVATRNADGELTAMVGTTFYDYSDQTTVQMRVAQVRDEGLSRVSIWSLGGNPWPNP